MQRLSKIAVLAIFAIPIMLVGADRAVKFAQAQSAPTAQPSVKVTTTNDLQRSVEIYGYHTVAPSGAARGEAIYYYKCWVCHNRYTIAAGSPAPTLKDIFKRANLVTGEPVNDETVAKQIRIGSAQMPSFGTSLRDADIADLVNYLHDKCCYEETNPPANPWYRAVTQNSPVVPLNGNLKGGPKGNVHAADGGALEGIMVQLIAPNAVRTTVYSNEDGQYEFPQLPSGAYTLRIAKPLQFLPYQRDAIQVSGAAALDDIVLQRRSDTDFLPPTEDVLSQLTGAEWMWNLPGTAEEKQTFSRNCGAGCHSYQQIMRNRLDERSWRLMVFRMLNYAGSPLIVRGRARNLDQQELIVKWLARVRGPEAKDAPLRVFPRPHGMATRVVVTEYELPHVLLAPHDVSGDSKGNIWYSSHRTPFMGRLDPRTGIVTEYQVPPTPPGILPGTHRMQVDKNDIVWASENWAHNVVRFDPVANSFNKVGLPSEAPLNAPMGGNLTLGPDGSVWHAQDKAVARFDSKTGKLLERVPFTINLNAPYDNIVTDDGNFWAGGSAGGGGDSIELMDTRTGKLLEVHSFSRDSTPAKGGFDPQGNPWFGGRGGALLKLDAKARQIREYWPPTPYVTFYEAMPDAKGEVWAGELHGGRMVRFNPQTERWIEYVLPEPYSHDRRTWIDNSTNPVTVWYVDTDGYLVRIQPLE
jgi:virginiamycin B lyase